MAQPIAEVITHYQALFGHQGYWYARSPELLHSPVMEALVWLRVPGDVVFAAGAILLLVFLVRLEMPAKR